MEDNISKMRSKTVQKALDSFRNRDYETAASEFLLAIEEDKNNPNILNNLGLCYLHLGDYVNAEKRFLEANELDERIEAVYLNLADLYYRQKRMLDAILILEKAISLIPDNIVLMHYLARICMEDTRYEEAIDLFDRILELSPRNYDAYWDLGQVYFALGDYSSAIANYETVLEHIDTNPAILYRTAEAYEANEERDKAISNYLKTIAANENFHLPYKKLGMLFLARGDKQDAIEYFEDYLKFELPDEEKASIENLINNLKA